MVDNAEVDNAETVRFVFEVSFDTGGGDAGLQMATLAGELSEFDGVSSVNAYGPMTTVVANPAYDHFVVDAEGGRWLRGTAVTNGPR